MNQTNKCLLNKTLNSSNYSRPESEAHSKPTQISMMKLFAKINYSSCKKLCLKFLTGI